MERYPIEKGEVMSKNPKLFLSILLAILFFSIFSISKVHANERFQWIHSNDTTTFEIDTQRFNSTDDTNWLYLDCWIKRKYNEQGVENVIAMRKEFQLPTNGYEDLEFSLSHELYAINKQNTIMVKGLYSVDYSSYGEPLDSISFPMVKWQETIPGSVFDAIALGVLQYKSTNNIKPTAIK